MRAGGTGERGSATAEAAVALLALAAVMAMMLFLLVGAGTQLRCVDAAREAARAVARGESVATAQQLASRQLPAGASVTISVEGELVRVRVAATIADRLGLSTRVSASATAAMEPSS